MIEDVAKGDLPTEEQRTAILRYVETALDHPEVEIDYHTEQVKDGGGDSGYLIRRPTARSITVRVPIDDSVPHVTVEGRKVWDPRLGPRQYHDAWVVSDNPALIMLDQMLGGPSGVRWVDWINQVVEVADYCDELVDVED